MSSVREIDQNEWWSFANLRNVETGGILFKMKTKIIEAEKVGAWNS